MYTHPGLKEFMTKHKLDDSKKLTQNQQMGANRYIDFYNQ